MNFATMLLAGSTTPLGTVSTPKAQDDFRTRGGNTRRENSANAYRRLLGDKRMTTGEIARARKISHMGCLSTLYTLEARGVIERCGVVPKTGGRGLAQVVWRVKNDVNNT